MKSIFGELLLFGYYKGMSKKYESYQKRNFKAYFFSYLELPQMEKYCAQKKRGRKNRSYVQDTNKSVN